MAFYHLGMVTGASGRELDAPGCALFQKLNRRPWANLLLPDLSPVPLPHFYVPEIPTVQYLWEPGSHPIFQIPLLRLLSHPVSCFLIPPFSPTHKKKVSQQEFEQLNTHLQYADENGEYADISAGDRVIDESIAASIADNAESNAAAAEAETQSSQPAKNSAVHNYLKQVHEQLQREEATHGKPLCYKRGDFFYRPPHAVFSLQKIKDTTGLDPSVLYARDVFVWLPHLLPGHPDQFKCTCGLGLSRNGVH